MMNTKTLLEKTQEFEKQSRLGDDKAKADLVAGTPAKLGTVQGPLFPGSKQLTLPTCKLSG